MRRGVVMQTVLTATVLGLMSLGATGAWRVRQGAQQALARAAALSEAQCAAESALEEAVFRLRRLEDPVKSGSVEPEATRALIREAGLARVSVSSVIVWPRAGLIELPGKPAQGVLDLAVRVRAGRASLFGSAVDRRLVRRYRYQLFRARDASGAVIFSQVRVMPEPLAQWVTE